MFEAIDEFINITLDSMGTWGPILGCFLILIESILPVLPLFVFITINFLAFGKILGFIISWVFTCLGCILSFFLFRKNIQTWLSKRLKEKGLISKKTINLVTNLKFEQLTTIIALPFTPAFLVNILAGVSKMKFKKYFFSLLIGKLFIVYFWGFIGVSLIDSIKNPIYLIRVAILLIIAYILSMLINKKFKFNE